MYDIGRIFTRKGIGGTTPRRGGWRCSRGQSSDVQGTSVDHPPGLCSGTLLNMVNSLSNEKAESLVKYGELTETPDCDFPDGGRNLTERTI